MTERVSAKTVTVEPLRAALVAISEMHDREPDGGMGWDPPTPDGESVNYGRYDDACRVCGTSDEYAVEWPCATRKAADEALAEAFLARTRTTISDALSEAGVEGTVDVGLAVTDVPFIGEPREQPPTAEFCPASMHHRITSKRASRMLGLNENGDMEYGPEELISDKCVACGFDFEAGASTPEPKP